jgi:hypothetical protein
MLTCAHLLQAVQEEAVTPNGLRLYDTEDSIFGNPIQAFTELKSDLRERIVAGMYKC